MERPVLCRDKKAGIQQYETYYKQLDLYYQFSHRMQKVIEEDWLRRELRKDGDEDHELSHQRQAELYCPVQILRKTASAGFHVPGV